tara:strand:- start:499 stop:1806 length:1308 start_codon:yes stop_codon:yes gene_type:complete
VNKIKVLFIIILFLFGCSLNSNSKFWTEEQDLSKITKNYKIIKVFKEGNNKNNEFNKNVEIKIVSNYKNKQFHKNLDNNFGYKNFEGKLEKISNYNFSKIKDFNIYKPDPIFHDNGIIFFESDGTIINFDFDSRLLWQQNIYSKEDKKNGPILFFSIYENYLIVADNLAKFYKLDLNSGKVLWTKQKSSPFNSQIKSYNNNFYLIDSNNVLRSISVIDGEENWKVKTDSFIIQSKKRLSIVLTSDNVFFINKVGDITAVDISTGNLLWQTPTQDTAVHAGSFSVSNSDLVLDKRTLFVSNNKNGFFSIDIMGGVINWKQDLLSITRPIIIQNLIFTVTLDGKLVVLEKKTGKIIRITNLFENLKKKDKENILANGFVIGKKNIYLSTNNGKLFLIDILTGKTLKIIKVDNQNISGPFVVNNFLYLIKNKSIIKLN